MKILVSNHSLKHAGGTETFTYTLIGELKSLGHQVEYFCIEKGMFSERIEKDFGVPFKTQKTYNLILANHHTTVNELYKCGLTIQTCHGIYPNLEQPSSKAHGYIAISQEVQNHLLAKGYTSKIIYNGIDCNRFKPTSQLSKDKPKILSLCHSSYAHSLVKEACENLNLEFSVLDKYTDNKWSVGEIINEHDLIIGLGRTAYEAFACGRPVVFFDKRYYAPALADGYFLDVITESLKNNCSGRALSKEFNAKDLEQEILKYHYQHGKIARNYAILSFNIQKTVADYFDYANLLQQRTKQKIFKAKVSTLIRKIQISIPTQLKTNNNKIQKK